MVTASTIHMAIVGAEGLKRVAAESHANTKALVERLTAIDGVQTAFNSPVFHEMVVQLELPASDVLKELATHNVLGGFALGEDYPELGNAILVCATETKTAADIDAYASKLESIFQLQASARCPVQPKMTG